MCKTTNDHIKNMKKNDIYCGRGKGFKWNPENCKPGESGYFGNPISINKPCPICSEIHQLGGSTLKCYEIYLQEKLKNNLVFKEEFFKLKGKKLICFCKPNPCHTDIMIQYLDGEKTL